MARSHTLYVVCLNPPPPVMPRFGALHGAFTGVGGGKFLASLGLLIRWILRA